MNAPDRLANLRVNPDWAKLPLFDRSKWQRVRFGDVVENLNETCDPSEAGIERYIGLEHLEPGSLHIRSWGNVANGTTFTRRARPGQVLFGKRRAYQRKVAVASFDAVVSGDIYVLAPKNNRLLGELLPFLCMSDRFFNHAVGTSAGSLSPRTNWSSLTNFEFDLPPLKRQQEFADVLTAYDDQIIAIENQAKALRGLANFIWANHLVQGDVRTVRIGEVANVSNGSTPSRKDDRYWAGGSIPWLPTGKVHDRYIQNAAEYITDIAIQEKRARIFPRGSVLVAMIGQGKTRGTAALMEIDASINQNFACITPHGVESHYLFFALEAAYEQLRRSSHGSNQEALNCGLVAKFSIPLPRPEVQRCIVGKIVELEGAQAQAEALMRSARKAISEFANYLA